MTSTARPADRGTPVPAATDAAEAHYLAGRHHDEWEALIGYAVEARDPSNSPEWRNVVAAELNGAVAMFARFTDLDRTAVKAVARKQAATR